MRAIRGAITVEENTVDAIEGATAEMLRVLQDRNDIGPNDIVSAFFSLTPDLNATFPARAARLAGWHEVPMLDTVEVAVPGALPRTIRVLLHAIVDRPVHHAYLGGARNLRPDLAVAEGSPSQMATGHLSGVQSEDNGVSSHGDMDPS